MSKVLKVGDVVIDLGKRQVLKGEQVQILPKRVQSLLLYFAANPNRVISKNELHAQVWESRPVEDSVFATTIWHVRQLLGDPDRQVLKTASRQGYILSVQATLDAEEPTQQALPEAEPSMIDAPSLLPAQDLALPTQEVVQDEVALTCEAGDLSPIERQTPINDSLSASKPIRVRAFLGLGAIVLLAAAYVALVWIRSSTPKLWVLIEESRDPAVSAYLSFVLQRQLEATGMGIASKNSPNALLSNSIVSSIDLVANRYRFTVNEGGTKTEYSAVISRPITTVLQGLLQKYAGQSSAKIKSPSKSRVRVNLDFSEMELELLRALKNEDVNSDLLAWLAFTKNELGKRQESTFFAREALATSSASAETICVAQYVLIDQMSPLESLSEPDCVLAKIRWLERQGKIKEARATDPIDTITKANPVLAMKAMELTLRIGFDATQDELITRKIEQMEQLALQSGWEAVMPRLYELRAQMQVLRLNTEEQKRWLEEAERGYRRLNDQTNGDRIVCKRLRLEGVMPEQKIMQIEGYLEAAEARDNPRLQFACGLARIKFKTKSDRFSERAVELRQLIDRLPINYERLEALIGLISQCGLYDRALAIRYSNQLYELSDGYPLMKLRAASQRAQFDPETQTVVQRFKDIEKLAQENGILSDFTTSWCVASDKAFKVGNYQLAERWAKACMELPIPVVASCVALFGVSVKMALNRKFKLPQLNFGKSISGHDRAWDSLPYNCAVGFYLISREIAKDGEFGFAIEFYREATSGRNLEQVRLFEGFLSAHRCFFEREQCDEKSARMQSANARFEIYDRGALLAAVIARHPQECRASDLAQLQLFAQQDSALAPQNACVVQSCNQKRNACKLLNLL